jgi:hypothetical protein
MMFDNLLADSESNPRSRIFSACMQSLKELENPYGVLQVQTNTIVTDSKAPVLALSCGGDMNAGALSAAKLESIIKQVLEHQPQLLGVGYDRW